MEEVKINITRKDYTWDGLGFNDYNFIRNVAPRICFWLTSICQDVNMDDSALAEKLTKIAKIIDSEDDSSKAAHWIHHDVYSPFLAYGECSECGFEQGLSSKLNYCPHCGVRMNHE